MDASAGSVGKTAAEEPTRGIHASSQLWFQAQVAAAAASVAVGCRNSRSRAATPQLSREPKQINNSNEKKKLKQVKEAPVRVFAAGAFRVTSEGGERGMKAPGFGRVVSFTEVKVIFVPLLFTLKYKCFVGYPHVPQYRGH